MKARVREMEAEAAKLREMQAQVRHSGRALSPFMVRDRQAVDADRTFSLDPSCWLIIDQSILHSGNYAAMTCMMTG